MAVHFAGVLVTGLGLFAEKFHVIQLSNHWLDAYMHLRSCVAQVVGVYSIGRLTKKLVPPVKYSKATSKHINSKRRLYRNMLCARGYGMQLY